MSARHWLNLISAVLFVFGMVFVVAGARAGKMAPPLEAQSVPLATPVASVRQIMEGIVAPAASAVFESVSTTITAAGMEEKQPRTEEEWASLGTSAASLVEAGNLLLMGDRAVDRSDWVTMSRSLIDAGLDTLKAVEGKDPDGVLAAGEKVNMACDACHQRYMRN